MRTFIAGATSTRPPKASAVSREDVVGDAVRELGERVGRERRDDEQVGVEEVRVQVARCLAARQRLEGVRGDEPLGVRRSGRA